MRFIGTARFMGSSLSNGPDNLAEGLLKSKCKDFTSNIEYTRYKDDSLTFKCVPCHKNFEKNLMKTFFCDGDIMKFCLKLGEVFSVVYLLFKKHFKIIQPNSCL